MPESPKKLEDAVATDPREVMGSLAHADDMRRAREKLDGKLIDGLSSKPTGPLSEADVREMLARSKAKAKSLPKRSAT
ncbi:MAG: hypothetical protein GY946_20360 [bacterium]|nr:hypothetical protein [bacterium]